MSGGDETWDRGVAEMDHRRFLEHTNEPLAERLKTLSDAVLRELKSYPSLFAYEKVVSRAARLGWIRDIKRRQNELQITFELDKRFNPVEPEMLEKLLHDLDIDQFEVHRTHWAVKEVDLERVLTKMGLLVSANPPETRDYKFSRRTVVRACTLMKTLSHAGFDAFLVELGAEGLNAGRERGSRQSRAAALAEYAAKHMEDVTADGELLSLAIVRRAAQLDADFPEGMLYDVDDKTRREFWFSLEQDGYAFVDGHLVIDAMGSGARAGREPQIEAAGEAVFANLTREKVELPSPRITTSIPNNKVFVVHGRDEHAKNDVARYVERLGLEAIVLHEQPNGGKTLMTKFMDVAAEVVFAVVLMTPDDFGGSDPGLLNRRARQNVIFELGFFIGALGSGKVCALVAGDVEKPSDFEGVVYVQYGLHTSWKMELARELRHAGVVFDPNKVF